jgi:hypothetical protein
MFIEIFKIIEPHLLGMALVFCLFVVIFDQKALDRIRSKPVIKRIGYFAIIIYYILIIIEIIKK